jgi:4-amino-4-deoxy-L-arabinose transferase-like glycosyltransferase
VTLVALGARLAWVATVAGHYRLDSDAVFYRLGGLELARGSGYVAGFAAIIAKKPPATALFPPGFVTYLGMAAWLFGRSRLVSQLAVCAAGTATVVCVGLVGRRIAGERVGIIAAAIAAVSPSLLVADGALMSETLFTLLVVLGILAAYRVVAHPSGTRWGVLAFIIGLAALTRGEGLLLVPLIFVPLARIGGWGSARTIGLMTFAAVVVLAVLAPWTARNSITFHHFVPISDNSGTMLRGANCRTTYTGERIGSWSYFCLAAAQVKSSRNEAVEGSQLRREGLDYARNHADRLPAVIAARLGRTFGFYRPLQGISDGTLEGRPYGMALAGWITFLILVPLAIRGSVMLVRNHVVIAPLMSAVALVAITSVLTYGNPRFRSALEPIVVILAAVALTGGMSRRATQGSAARAHDVSYTEGP